MTSIHRTRDRKPTALAIASGLLLLSGLFASHNVAWSPSAPAPAPAASGGPLVDPPGEASEAGRGDSVVPMPAAVAAPPGAPGIAMAARGNPTPAAPRPPSGLPMRMKPPAKAAPVTPTPSGGSPSSFRLTSTDSSGRPTRWDPCTVIRWAFNPDQAPAGALDVTRDAVGRLAASSGLQLTYVGTTAFKPLKDPEGSPPAGIDAVIAFGTSAEYPDFTNATVGIGGFTSMATTEGPLIIRGGVAFNAPAFASIPDGFGQGPHRGSALLHELGHMVGLDHVNDAAQIMNSSFTRSTPPDYAAGDLTGLMKVGAPAGCFPMSAQMRQQA